MSLKELQEAQGISFEKRHSVEKHEIWEAKLQCGDIIQFAEKTPNEIANDGMRCPIHPDKYPGFISPIYQKIISIRRVKI